LGNLSLAQLKRLSVIKADQKDESDGEEIWNWKSNTHLSNIPLFSILIRAPPKYPFSTLNIKNLYCTYYLVQETHTLISLLS
jgi:hypothetical protein